jgi:hypothetical protein
MDIGMSLMEQYGLLVRLMLIYWIRQEPILVSVSPLFSGLGTVNVSNDVVLWDLILAGILRVILSSISKLGNGLWF